MVRGACVLLLIAGASPAGAAPLAEIASSRRAIRGSAVETARESDELKRLREFEEESFPRPGTPPLGVAGAPSGGPASVDGEALPARPAPGAIAPDALPSALRSPEAPHPNEPATAPAIPWLQQILLPDLPIRLEARVLRYLEFYRSDPRGHAIMSSWLRKQGRWRALFEDALRRSRLPLGLAYVSMIESGYDPLDRSHAGAVGLWQFLPEGGRIYGLRIDYWVDERRNPERSTEAAMHYLGDLQERFGAWPLALAAFNAGYGAVLRAMQKYNTNDYWELCRHEDGLPWETVLYVPKAMAAAIVGENRKLFGYDAVPGEPPYAYDRVRVPSSTSLAAIARAAGVPVAEVAALNPELRRKRTPPEPWEVRVPLGAGPRLIAAYEAHREMVKPLLVRFGERLDDVARAHGVSTHELRQLNGVDDLSEIRPGVTLLVPDGPRAGSATPPSPPACATVIVAVPDKDLQVAGHKRVFYRTLPQDAIADIATFFKVKPIDLQRWNNLDLDAKLAAGMVLQIFVAADFDTTQAALVDPAVVRLVQTGSEEFFDLVEARRGRVRLRHTVQRGEDLKRIGKRYGLTVADLERINRFGARHTDLTVGQKITVYRAMTAGEKAQAACAPPLTSAVAEHAAAAPPVEDPLVDEEAEASAHPLPGPPPADDAAP
jgi:membrane-bound lytic murein transglycosylase D